MEKEASPPIDSALGAPGLDAVIATPQFQMCVRDSARDARIVSAFNELFGARSVAPITPLLLRGAVDEFDPSIDRQKGADSDRHQHPTTGLVSSVSLDAIMRGLEGQVQSSLKDTVSDR